MCLKLLMLSIALALTVQPSKAQDEMGKEQQVAGVSLESLFGQAAKTFVYGGASVARFNSGLLCPLLKRQTERDNEDQPTLFVFNNNRNREHAFRIYADDDINENMVKEAQFEPDQMTIIFIHGWLGGIHNELWLSESKNAALNQQSTNSTFRPNVIIVDWSEFAQGSLYTATENSFKVSRRLSRLLEQLVRVAKIRPELMHCMGHSIGTHICGQAARYAFPQTATRSSGSSEKRMGRITGLDPGGFCYELGIQNETAYLGLKPSDAIVVDAYYSNRSPFGNKYRVAKYNVRLNNGFFQQPCSVWRNSQLAAEYFRAAVRFTLGNIGHNDILTCDHYFATRFAQQILTKSCNYVAYACDSYRNFLRGRCGLCNSINQCYSMDFEYQRANASTEHALNHLKTYSQQFNDDDTEDDATIDQVEAEKSLGGVAYAKRRIYYMRIADQQPYCSTTFRLRVHLDRETIDVQSFRSEWLKLRLLDSNAKPIEVRDAYSGKLTDSIGLYGVWTNRDNDANMLEEFGVDERTLTALIELSPDDLLNRFSSRVEDILVEYDNELSRRQDPFANPIEFIQLDLLSSSDERIRSKNSRSFEQNQFKVIYKHLGGSALVKV